MKQVNTPDGCKRQSPAHMYRNVVNKESSHRVHSNVGSANHSFLNPSMTSTSAIEQKWTQLNHLTKNSGMKHPHEMRNTALRNQKKAGGLTHDFGSSLSSHEKANHHLKNHKLSCDASLYSRHHKNGYVENASPITHKYNKRNANSKYNENEMLRDYVSSTNTQSHVSPALSQIEKNLTSYFTSNDYPYNEVKSYLENTSSLPNMDTGESAKSSINVVSCLLIIILVNYRYLGPQKAVK